MPDTINKMEDGYLTNQFLIAMPGMADPHFFRSVTFICEHNSEGAMGLIINHPLDITLREVLAHINIPTGDDQLANEVVYGGGPVQPERGFVLHRPYGNWEATLKLPDNIGVTTSRDILVTIATDNEPEDHLVTLGYAGWGAGQLEREIAENAWLSGPSDARIIFELPSTQRWEAAARLVGVDLNLLSSDIGHA